MLFQPEEDVLDGGGNSSIPSTETVPDYWPDVPVIAVNRHPVFPKFIKIVELNDEKLVNTIRRKVKLNQPYVGIFVKKDDENTSEVVSSLEELYPTRTFAMVVELQDLGQKVRMVLMAHRRIRILDRTLEESEPLVITKLSPEVDGEPAKTETTEIPVKEENQDPRVLIGHTENVVHQEFETTAEVKAMTQELIKTIRDIIALNPLYRDSLQQMLQHQFRVVDNPVYLSDLGAALTGGDTAGLMAVIEEEDIPSRLMLSLKLLKKEYELSKLQQKIGKEVEEKVKTTQRKFMLQEQLKIIKKELGMEKDDTETILEKLNKKLEGKTVPEAARTVIDEEINKLRFLDAHSSEFSVTRNYLDWLTVLPWGLASQENLDLAVAREVLDEDHYGLDDVKKRILEFIAVSQLKGSVQGKIICLSGQSWSPHQ